MCVGGLWREMRKVTGVVVESLVWVKVKLGDAGGVAGVQLLWSRHTALCMYRDAPEVVEGAVVPACSTLSLFCEYLREPDTLHKSCCRQHEQECSGMHTGSVRSLGVYF